MRLLFSAPRPGTHERMARSFFSDPLGRPAPGAECLVYPFARRSVWREKETGERQGGRRYGRVPWRMFLFFLSLTHDLPEFPAPETRQLWLADQDIFTKGPPRPDCHHPWPTNLPYIPWPCRTLPIPRHDQPFSAFSLSLLLFSGGNRLAPDGWAGTSPEDAKWFLIRDQPLLPGSPGGVVYKLHVYMDNK